MSDVIDAWGESSNIRATAEPIPGAELLTMTIRRVKNVPGRSPAPPGKPVPPAAPSDVISSDLDAGEAEFEWLAEHYDEIKEKAAGAYVVVWRGGRIVEIDLLLESAVARAEGKGAKRNELFIDYVPAKGETWIL